MRTQCCHGVTVYLHDYRHTYDKKDQLFFPNNNNKTDDYDRKGKIK